MQENYAADDALRIIRKRRTPQTLSSAGSGRGSSPDEPSTMATTVERQVPQRLPAPVLVMTSTAVQAPLPTKSRISFSDTATQMHTYIVVSCRPAPLLLLRIAFK